MGVLKIRVFDEDLCVNLLKGDDPLGYLGLPVKLLVASAGEPMLLREDLSGVIHGSIDMELVFVYDARPFSRDKAELIMSDPPERKARPEAIIDPPERNARPVAIIDLPEREAQRDNSRSDAVQIFSGPDAKQTSPGNHNGDWQISARDDLLIGG